MNPEIKIKRLTAALKALIKANPYKMCEGEPCKWCKGIIKAKEALSESKGKP